MKSIRHGVFKTAVSSLLAGLVYGREAKAVGAPHKLFDSGEGFGALKNLATLTDASVARRGGRWCLFLAGMDRTTRSIRLFTATLPEGAELDDPRWSIATQSDDPSLAQALADPPTARNWDGTGRHCPAYAQGWDPTAARGKGDWRERIYYAGSDNKTYQGPYAIGCLEWDGTAWRRLGDGPVFSPSEAWENGSVFEPNVVYAGGKWRLWYCFGPSKTWRFGIGYAESVDGKTNWTGRQICFPETTNLFDFAVAVAGDHFEAVFARNPWARLGARKQGLFWTATKGLSGASAADWTAKKVRLLRPVGGEAWYRNGIWKPTFHRSDADPTRLHVFFDGSYPSGLTPPQRPYHLTLGRIDCRVDG
jgi:hypothetical protein